MSIFNFKKANQQTLDKGLEKSKFSFLSALKRLVREKSKIDPALLDELEEILIAADVGIPTTLEVIKRIEQRVAKDKYVTEQELVSLLCEEMAALLETHRPKDSPETPDSKPHVILVVGVNGVGKTTTIGKLAHLYKTQNQKVILGAADTFRAAAIDQLEIWAQRAGVSLIKQKMGSDPAAVAYDTVSAAMARQADLVIIDTAGRLHNKAQLMSELSKIKNVAKKLIPDAPHEVLLVLDGSTGQNGFRQAEQFAQAAGVTALAITKLDGTAKGGVVMGICNELKIPVKYIGLGEKIEDLQPFNARQFVESFFNPK